MIYLEIFSYYLSQKFELLRKLRCAPTAIYGKLAQHLKYIIDDEETV